MTKKLLKLGLTSGGQTFLSKVKTNTIKLFEKQSIITEESVSQCMTSAEPSTFKLSPVRNSDEKQYFNQS